MMPSIKRLVIVRHANAADVSFTEPDFFRDLTELGRAEAKAVGCWLNTIAPVVDLALVSSAIRAINTAKIFFDNSFVACSDVVYTQDLYECSVQSILEQIAWIATESTRSVLVVGHNPAVTNLVQHITGERQRGLATAGVVVVTFPAATPWSTLVSGTIDKRISPQDLL